ncbi:MAG: flagellar motor protein MotA, partial [Gammaproteobacteria bacterium]|nr:flagellar motor protein MotA [Gammaproteobacteria bacterium]
MKSISLSTLAGIFLGFGLFVFSIIANTNTYGIFWSTSSLLLVLGGTLAATMISYEGRYVWKALLTLGQVIIPTQVNHKVLYQEVSQVIAWGKVGAKDGLPGLEKEFAKLQGHEDPFLHHCIQLLMAGYSQDDLRGKLTTAMDTQYERQMVQAGILNTMANIA